MVVVFGVFVVLEVLLHASDRVARDNVLLNDLVIVEEKVGSRRARGGRGRSHNPGRARGRRLSSQ